VASPIKLDEVTRGVFIAWRLFLWDRQAVALVDDSPRGALKSFWCAALVLPLVFVNWAFQAATPDNVPGSFGMLVDKAGWGRTLTVLAIFAVIHWTAWPVIMHWLAAFLNSGRFYFRYLAAYNWSTAVVAVLTVLYAVINFSGVASGQVMVLISLSILTVMWAYHWFILSVALEINGGFAAVLVAAEFILSVIVDTASTATIT